MARTWTRDYTVWSPKPVSEIGDRLGRLTMPEAMQEQAEPLKAFADEIRAEGIPHIVLLGMGGGSSLAPEVFQKTFGGAPGYPGGRSKAYVVDVTDLAAPLMIFGCCRLVKQWRR